MPDFDAIATAIAARYAPGTMTPPAGLAAVRQSTADVPNQLDPLPSVLVFPSEGEFVHSPSKRDGTHQFKVQFFYSMGIDLKRDAPALRRWATVLVDQLKASAQLAGTVASARCTAWRVVKLVYAGEDFNGVELDVEVITAEPWSAVS